MARPKIKQRELPVGVNLPAVLDTTGMSQTDPEMAALFTQMRGPGGSLKPANVPGPFDAFKRFFAGFGRKKK